MTVIRIQPASTPLALHGEAASRRVEQRAAAPLPPHALMQRAGLALAQLAQALAPHAQRVWVAAGPGNNGGDGLEAASLLQRARRTVQVTLVADVAQLPADAAASLQRARDAGVEIGVVAPDSAVGVNADADAGADANAGAGAAAALGPHDIAIDALLGLGVTRAPASALLAVFQQLNALRCTVLAVDLPSGLSAGTGQPAQPARPAGSTGSTGVAGPAETGLAVRARHTLSLLTLKPGLFTGAGREFAGSVWFDDLGAAEERDAEAPTAWLCGHDAAAQAALATRHAASHKGSYGDVAVVGGAPGMTGAALLAARAAQAAGAGRVFVELLGAPADSVDALRPELMFRHGWCTQAPALLAATTVACGCGGGDSVRAVLPRLLGAVPRLVLDADALNAVAGDAHLQALLRARAARGCATVLTPHPLEAARLLGCSTAEVQADRLHAAQQLAERFCCVAVLKGSGSVIAAPGLVPCINATGNASLASAGTGDVLAGWLAGLWAQWPAGRAEVEIQADAVEAPDGTSAAFTVARHAVAAHGAAAEPERPGALRAGDLIEILHRRLREGQQVQESSRG